MNWKTLNKYLLIIYFSCIPLFFIGAYITETYNIYFNEDIGFVILIAYFILASVVYIDSYKYILIKMIPLFLLIIISFIFMFFDSHVGFVFEISIFITIVIYVWFIIITSITNWIIGKTKNIEPEYNRKF
ncbi:MAG: hypothetical protein WC867_02365 [Candidatus Pacearchaeota archaeon]|jgi:hypothetical protein